VEPILARPATRLPVRAGGFAFEAKWDGYRVLVFAAPGAVYVQSRRGSDLGPAFPEIVTAAEELARAEPCVLDGELVVANTSGRLDFELLATRARRTGARAAAGAEQQPAHVVLFDCLETGGEVIMRQPYTERRALLEDLFTRQQLHPPWTLCPSTTDRGQAAEWLSPDWAAVGIEGVICKGLKSHYRPGIRGWEKLRSRQTADAVVGAVTGSITLPSTLLLGRWDGGGRLRLVAQTTPMPTPLRRDLGYVLGAGAADHPWRSVSFSSWHSDKPLHHRCVAPHQVVEFEGDAAVDSGRWRHPVRALRLRPDLGPGELPLFGKQ